MKYWLSNIYKACEETRISFFNAPSESKFTAFRMSRNSAYNGMITAPYYP